MALKPTYEELLQKVKELEEEKCAWQKDSLVKASNSGSRGTGSVGQHKDSLEKTGSLKSIINVEELQSIMDDFHNLTGMVTAILDMDGNVIEATGWQDICTKFHRLHPKTAQNCTESDLYLVKNIKPGEYTDYKCKNGLWDVVTPLYIGNKHMGNIYTGQFFYDDDPVDEHKFIQQAEEYGFDKDSYLEAFSRIPRYSREAINNFMRFLVKLTSYISSISYTKMKLEMESHERRHAEDELQISEGRLRTLINALPDLVWLKDIDGSYLACNARFEQFFGAKEKEILGKTDYEFVNKDLADFFRAHDKAAIAKGGPNINEEEITFADDGHQEILETIKTPIYSIDGQVSGILGIGRDITELKRTETALRGSKQRFEKMLGAVPDMISIHDPEMNILYSNWQGFGAVPEGKRLLGTKCYHTYRGFDNPCPDCQAKQALKTGQPFQTEARLPDGKWVDLRVIPFKGSDDRIEMFMEWVRDITVSKHFEMELRSQKNLLEGVFDAIKDVIGVQHPDHTMVRYNRAGYELLGVSEEQVKGKKCYELLGRFSPCGICPTLKATISRKMETLEKYVPELDKHFICTSNPVLDDNGDIKLIIEQLTDITEEKKNTERLRQAQKMESIGSLAGGIAHDFNNLLFPIIGMSELLLEDLPPGTSEYENVQEILRAGKRGGDLVKQILSFSRQNEHMKVAVNVQKIIEEAIKLSRATIPTDIEISQCLQPDCGLLMADPTQMHQVAMNLITNAYHAVIDAGGRIEVQLKEVQLETDKISVNIKKPGKYALFSISDTGVGIPENHLEKIFDPYFTTKNKDKGTGLGLSVVYGIVQEHQGDIIVYSEVGKGTAFNVYLPLMQLRNKAEPDEKNDALTAGTERILLIDDEAPIVRLEKQMLERLGYRVDEYDSSLDALESFKTDPSGYDLVITDMNMQNMTGDKLAAKILTIRDDIPIIICTGFSERINNEQAQAMGVKGFLMKPVLRTEMAKEIRRVLDIH